MSLSKELKFATLYDTNAFHSMVLHWILDGMKESIDELVDNINHMRYLGLKD
ncbi:TetR-like C-terminal domain-containing protein [Catenibacterium sp. GCM10023432]|uniref:TetR-like C-terminal domain-containing protein n=1 Tax=Catenibacterium sp. GCM10023432 TaxID=3252638 RepID=UPI0036141222